MWQDVANGLDVTCFIGAPQSGRTGRLVELACRCAKAGERVLFVTARERDLTACRARLDAAGGCAVRTATCEQLAVEVLSLPLAGRMFGRRARVLAPYEEALLREDLKACRMRSRRLRQVLTYLRAGWQSLSDDTRQTTPEEDLVTRCIDANLRFTGGVLSCEASNLAVRVLRQGARERAQAAWDCVVVDDYELLSRASQHLVRMLAGGKLIVASGSRPSLPGDEDNPCFEGASELARACPGARIEACGGSAASEQVSGVLQALAADQALEALGIDGVFESCGCVRGGADSGPLDGRVGRERACEARECGRTRACEGAVRMLPSMEAEMQALALAADEALKRGESVLIVGTNRLWRRNVAANLSRAGLPVMELAEGGLRLGDLRDPAACERLRRDALARLAADPDDGVAWRTLVALGDAVGRSAAVDRLRQVACLDADGEPVGLREALELLAAGKVAFDELDAPLFEDLLRAYSQVKQWVSQEAGRLSAASGGEDGAGMPPQISQLPRASAVAVCSPQRAAGMRADTVLFGGFVDGLIPCRAYFDPAGLAGSARQRERVRAVRSAYSVASCARKRILLTGFSTCSLQAAETMDIHIASIKLRRGTRIAYTRASEVSRLLL